MPNIGNMRFDQKSPQPPEEGVSKCHKQTDRQTDRHTDGHCDSITESAQWADSVKIYIYLFTIKVLVVGKYVLCMFLMNVTLAHLFHMNFVFSMYSRWFQFEFAFSKYS